MPFQTLADKYLAAKQQILDLKTKIEQVLAEKLILPPQNINTISNINNQQPAQTRPPGTQLNRNLESILSENENEPQDNSQDLD